MATVTIKINVPVDIYQDGGVFVANCRRFGVVTQGCTRIEAERNISDALVLFFETCLEMGTMDEVLKECGFERVSISERDPEPCGTCIEVALPFMAHNHLRECRV